MSKSLLRKVIVDPLPFLEYFLPEGDVDLGNILMPPNALRAALKFHTVNTAYANSIARKMGMEFNYVHPVVLEDEVERFLLTPMSDQVKQYLADRSFPLELVPLYKMTSYRWNLEHIPPSMKNYFLFNQAELNYANFMFSIRGYPEVKMEEESFVAMPSYDRDGRLNNLVFRVVSDQLSQFAAKWLFTHGRQATFGLERVDPTKPVYVVEGFFDYVAMDQMGIQAVGLGSAFISDAHWKFLDGLNLIFLLDSDPVGQRYGKELQEQGHTVRFLGTEYKDPYEYWISNKSIESFL
jgi:hypothetical protein